MSPSFGPEDLEKLRFENEIALRRARRLIQFMRTFYQNEAQRLNDEVETTDQSSPEHGQSGQGR